jgi:hypothetical protein
LEESLSAFAFFKEIKTSSSHLKVTLTGRDFAAAVLLGLALNLFIFSTSFFSIPISSKISKVVASSSFSRSSSDVAVDIGTPKSTTFLSRLSLSFHSVSTTFTIVF